MASRFSIEAVFKAIDQMTAPIKKMTLQNKKFVRGIKTDFAKAQRSFHKFGESFKKNLGRVFRIGLLAAGAAVGLTVKKMVSEAALLENIVTDFKVLTGSMENAKNLVNELRMLSAKTPLQFEGIAESSKLLLAFGVANEDVTRTVKLLGDAALGDQEKLIRLSRAYGKVKALGKASMKEIKMVTNAAVPILGTLAKNLGVTQAELLDMVRAGKITSDVFEQAFITMTSKGGNFYNGMIEKSKTLTGLFSTFKDVVSIVAGNFGQELLPIMKKYLKIAIKFGLQVIDWIKNNKELIKINVEKWLKKTIRTVKLAIKIFTFLFKVLKPLAPFIIAVVAAWKAYQLIMFIAAAAQAVLNAVMTANPIGLIIVAVGALIAAIILLVKHWKTVSAFTKKWWDILKGLLLLFSPFTQMLVFTVEIVRSLIEHWDEITKAFKEGGILAGIMAIGKAILDGMLAPIQSFLELVSKIPGVGNLAKGGALKIAQLRENLFKSSDATSPIGPSERSSITREESVSRGELTIKDQTGRAEMTKNPTNKRMQLRLQSSGAF